VKVRCLEINPEMSGLTYFLIKSAMEYVSRIVNTLNRANSPKVNSRKIR
jgi:hypothetical protein